MICRKIFTLACSHPLITQLMKAIARCTQAPVSLSSHLFHLSSTPKLKTKPHHQLVGVRAAMLAVMQVVKQQHRTPDIANEPVLLFNPCYRTIHPLSHAGIRLTCSKPGRYARIHTFRFQASAEATTCFKFSEQSRTKYPEIRIETVQVRVICDTLIPSNPAPQSPIEPVPGV